MPDNSVRLTIALLLLIALVPDPAPASESSEVRLDGAIVQGGLVFGQATARINRSTGRSKPDAVRRRSFWFSASPATRPPLGPSPWTCRTVSAGSGS